MSEQLEISSLQNAFNSLSATLEELADVAWFNQQKPIIQDTLIAGAIQKFEFVYELSLKMMKRQLKLMAIAEDLVEPDHFRDILRDAAKFGLIQDIDAWVSYRQMRNITSHTYDQDKAMAIYSRISDFLVSSGYLLAQLDKWNSSNAN